MKNFLIQSSYNEVAGMETLEYDLLTATGQILFPKGQKVDAGLLLQLNYLKFFRSEDKNSETELTRLIKNLGSVCLCKNANLIEIKHAGKKLEFKIYKDNNEIDFYSFGAELSDEIFNYVQTIAGVKNPGLSMEKEALLSFYDKVINANFVFDYQNQKTVQIHISGAKNSNPSSLYDCGISKKDNDVIKDLKTRENTLFVVLSKDISCYEKLFSCVLNSWTKNEDNFSVVFGNLCENKNTTQNIILFKDMDIHQLAQSVKKAGNDKKIVVFMNNYNKELLQELLIILRDDSIKNYEKVVMFKHEAKKLCPECKEQYELAEDEIKSLFYNAEGEKVLFFRDKGCNACNKENTDNNVPLYSLVKINGTEEKDIEYFTNSLIKRLRFEGIKKAVRGITSIKYVDDAADNFQTYLT